MFTAKDKTETYVIRNGKSNYTALVKWSINNKQFRKTKEFKQFTAASKWCSKIEKEVRLLPEFKG